MKSPQIEKALKRQCYKTNIAGDDFYFKSMSMNDSLILDAMEGVEKIYWAIGNSFCEPDGSLVFNRESTESVEDFAKRVQSELGDMGQDMCVAMMDAIVKLGKVPSQETLQKN